MSNKKFKAGQRYEVVNSISRNGNIIEITSVDVDNVKYKTIKGKDSQINFVIGSMFSACLKKLKNEAIVIYRTGNEVHAINKASGEKAIAKCCPDDEFDFKIGAKLAFERLINNEPANHKITTDKLKVGDVVRIIDSGRMFTNNHSWVRKNVPDLAVFYAYGDSYFDKGIKRPEETFTIRFIDEIHAYIQKRCSDDIENNSGACYLINVEGIEKVDK